MPTTNIATDIVPSSTDAHIYAALKMRALVQAKLKNRNDSGRGGPGIAGAGLGAQPAGDAAQHFRAKDLIEHLVAALGPEVQLVLAAPLVDELAHGLCAGRFACVLFPARQSPRG